MAYQTLYRKYRPKTFELVYGQDTIVKTLKNVIKNQKLSHAYLFTGPRGTGKTSSAKLFAKAINCLNNQNGDACNECENCKSFNENSNPDIIEMDAASNNGVDEIREIKNKVNLVPSISKYKVYIIDEVHMLSIGAFNALLKTLEEPPEYIIFILATTDPQKLPPTIISRCQRFDFTSISHDKMKECLENIVKNENIDIEDAALEEIINNSKGGMRDAIGMLDQASVFADGKVTATDVEELSGSISIKEVRELIEDILKKDYQLVFEKVNNYSSLGKDFSLICEKIIIYIRTGILFKKNVISNNISEEDKKIYNSVSDSILYLITDFISESLLKLKDSYQKELTFEVQMVQLIDKIAGFSLNNMHNVSRETLQKSSEVKNQPIVINDVPRETSKSKSIKNTEISSNVSRETLEKNNDSNKNSVEKLNKIKNIRINNILKESTKQDITFILDLWSNINDYIIDEKYKMVAGILKNAKPVAASKNGIIITLPLDSIVNRIEKEYDNSKELLKEIYNESYKLVYITNDYWQKVRPEYVAKARNGELELINEEEALNELKEINSNNSVNEFNELIEMEEN